MRKSFHLIRPGITEWFRQGARTVSFLLIPVVLSSVWLLAGLTSIDALDEGLSTEANGDNPLGIVIERSDQDSLLDDKALPKKSVAIDVDDSSDLIEELVFPFSP